MGFQISTRCGMNRKSVMARQVARKNCGKPQSYLLGVLLFSRTLPLARWREEGVVRDHVRGRAKF